MATQRVWRLAAHPVGMVKPADFSLGEEPVPLIAKDEVLVRVLYLSLDPAMRGWITGRRTYVEGVQVGDVMRAGGVGRVVESQNPAFAPGDLVFGMLNWQEFAAIRPRHALDLRKLPPGISPTLALGPLGITGLTAYFGLLDVGKPKEGETVVVSAAAGATGSVVAQIAKIKGCRAIGIAGGPDKCKWLKEECRLDGVIDYKSENVSRRLREYCPNGLDIYFDNVGGQILEAALDNLASRARVVLCGGISQYNATELPPGPRNYLNLLVTRSRMEGFIVMDYLARADEAIAELAGWVFSDRIKYREDIVPGIENAPAALIRLFEGKNQGKQLLQVGADA